MIVRIRWWGLALCLAASPCLRAAERVVAVRSADSPMLEEALQGFRSALADAGLAVELRAVTLPADPAAAQPLLAAVDGEHPKLVLAMGYTAARAARARIKSAPVVFCMVLDKDQELNYGGVTLSLPLEDYIARIRRNLPWAGRIGVIHNPARSPEFAREVEEQQAKGAVLAASAESPAQVDRAMMALQGKIGCLLLVPDPTLFNQQTLSAFLSQSLQKGIPVVGMAPAYAKAGAIAAFYPDFRNNGALAAGIAARLIKGDTLHQIPVLAPTKVGSTFNLVVARHLNKELSGEDFRSSSDIIR